MGRTALWWVAALALGACSPPAAPAVRTGPPTAAGPAQPTQRPPLPPPNATTAQAPPGASAAPAASAEPAPSPPPAPPPAYGPDPPLPDGPARAKLELAKALCPAAIQHDGQRVQIGCRSCPPFGDANRPDGTVALDPEDFWPIEVLVPGSFTRPGADQMAVGMVGCEPHAANYGGTLLAEQRDGVWQQVAYASGVHPKQAKSLRLATGRDLLVYRYTDVHQSTGTDSILAYDFTQGSEDDAEPGMQLVVEMADNSFSVCWGLNPEGAVMQGQVDSFTVSPAQGGRSAELVVTVRHASAPYSAALAKRVETACQAATTPEDEPPTIDPRRILGPLRPYRLVFAPAGTQLVPTKATAATMAHAGIMGDEGP